MSAVLRAVLVDYDQDLFDLQADVLSAMQVELSRAEASFTANQLRSEEALLHSAADADLVMIQSLRPLLNAAVIGKLNRCRGIIRVGIGYDSVDVAAATRLGIPVSNVVGWCDHEVAEHALALLLACARRLTTLDRSIQRGEWSRILGRPAQRLAGKTLGLVGLGRIGSTLALKAAALELQMLAYDPHLEEQEIQRRGAKPASLEKLLSDSDFVSLHVSLNTATHKLIGASELAQMKPGAVLINTSRGGVLDEDALYQALAEGRLGAAGLDVFAQEPLPASSRLRQLDNVVMSPHLGSYSQEAVTEMYLRSARLAAAILQGCWVDTIVNPQVRQQAEARWRSLNEKRGG